MTFPNINPLVETFLEPTRIHLFGKPFPTKNTTPESMIHKVEVYQGGKMYQLSSAPVD